MRVRFMPEAMADADHAADFYAAAEPDGDLDVEFLAEVKRVARLIGERPLAWTEIEPGVRRAVHDKTTPPDRREPDRAVRAL